MAEFGALSAQGIGETTPMGANLVPAGGATCRVWAPNALEVHVRLSRTGDVIGEPGESFQPTVETRLHELADGHWAGLAPGAREGDRYRFYIVQRQQPYKRDPYARELEFYDWPNVDCMFAARGATPGTMQVSEC